MLYDAKKESEEYKLQYLGIWCDWKVKSRENVKNCLQWQMKDARTE